MTICSFSHGVQNWAIRKIRRSGFAAAKPGQPAVRAAGRRVH